MTVLGRRVFVSLLLAVVAFLPAGVYSEPLDPTWLGGIWDDDDFDTLALHVTHFEASLADPVPAVAATTMAIGVAPVTPSEAPLPARPLPFHRRGPPSA